MKSVGLWPPAVDEVAAADALARDLRAALRLSLLTSSTAAERAGVSVEHLLRAMAGGLVPEHVAETLRAFAERARPHPSVQGRRR